MGSSRLSEGSGCLFEREHHLRIATVLQALDANVLLKSHCYFGSGTAIVLTRDEYRESIDIDFLISDLISYRALRHQLSGPGGFATLTRQGVSLKLARELRADQYGLRTLVDVGGQAQLKFEIFFESRIHLETPGPNDQVCGIATLTSLDMATTKLLANSDRGSDDSVFSRDLIDLAMIDGTPTLRREALEKAMEAYGDAAERDLLAAIARLRQRRGRLETCMTALKMDSVPPALLWSRIRGWESSARRATGHGA